MKIRKMMFICAIMPWLPAVVGCTSFSASNPSSGIVSNLSTAPATGTIVLLSTQHNLLATNQILVQTPASPATVALYSKPHSVLERGNLLPNLPQAARLNSSQQMVYMLTATEHCRDLVDAEAAIPDSNKAIRKFFTQQNLSTTANTLSPGDFQAAGISLGNSFWRRSLADDEKSMLSDLFTELSGQSLGNQNMLISLCTVELASASSLVH